MLTRSTKLKLVAFAVVSILALTYGLVVLLRVQDVVRRPDVVRAVFTDPQGIYPLADVDVLGVHVGSVRGVDTGPGTDSTVVMEIDRNAHIPRDVHAVVSSKSAIGEQYVELVPKSSTGPTLGDGDTIPLASTTSPPNLGKLIGDVDSLVRSVPRADLRTALDEGSTALNGLSPSLARVLQDSDQLSGSALRNSDNLISLIRSARTVLDTQVQLGGATKQYAASLAGLTTQLHELDPTFDQVLVRGVATGQQVTGLLQDNQAALPVLLDNLAGLTTLGDQQLPGIRKSLVVFPWTLEYNSQALRYCDKVDAKTGNPVKGTCHYDAQGRPIWSAHVADVYKARGNAPDNPCTHGYESTRRYLPNGEPASGSGPKEADSAEPNFAVHCAAPPTDSQTPNVRGFQNLGTGNGSAQRVAPAWGRGSDREAGLAMMDPESGIVVTPQGLPLQLVSHLRPVPTDGRADLGWLMTHLLTD